MFHLNSLRPECEIQYFVYFWTVVIGVDSLFYKILEKLLRTRNFHWFDFDIYGILYIAKKCNKN